MPLAMKVWELLTTGGGTTGLLPQAVSSAVADIARNRRRCFIYQGGGWTGVSVVVGFLATEDEMGQVLSTARKVASVSSSTWRVRPTRSGSACSWVFTVPMVVLSWVTSVWVWAMRPGRSAEAALAFLMSGCSSASLPCACFRVLVRFCSAAFRLALPSGEANWLVMTLRLPESAAMLCMMVLRSSGLMEWVSWLICESVDFTSASTGCTCASIWSTDMGWESSRLPSLGISGLSGEPALLLMAALPITESLLISAVESARMSLWNFSSSV